MSVRIVHSVPPVPAGGSRRGSPLRPCAPSSVGAEAVPAAPSCAWTGGTRPPSSEWSHGHGCDSTHRTSLVLSEKMFWFCFSSNRRLILVLV